MARILLVEDQGLVRDALRAVLAQRGHDVLAASDGESALALLQGGDCDLIILDRQLPGISGSEALREMRRRGCRARVIILTGHVDEDWEERYRDLRIGAFLSKEIGIEALLHVVDRELARGRRRAGGQGIAPPEKEGQRPEAPPRSAGTASPAPIAPPSAAQPPEEPAARILVVEDEDSVRSVLRRFLERKGYAVETAADGAAAIEAIRARAPHVVLLDLSLPGTGGIEVLRRLRAERGAAGVPLERPSVIVATGVDDLATARECMALGASDYILKPFNFDYLELTLWAKILSLEAALGLPPSAP